MCRGSRQGKLKRIYNLIENKSQRQGEIPAAVAFIPHKSARYLQSP